MTNEESVKDMTSKFDKMVKFEGQDFRRWQKNMHFLLTTLKVVYVLSTPSPVWSENESLETIMKRMKWENDDYICHGHILNDMSDSLFDIYQNAESAKALWESLESKYMAEDASAMKFLVSNFMNYKMVDTRPIMEQYHEMLRILGQYTQNNLMMDEAISVAVIIDKLPHFWKEFTHGLKHKKEELNLVQLGSHLRIKEGLRNQKLDNNPKGKNQIGSSSVNMVERDGAKNSKNNKNKRKFKSGDDKFANKKGTMTCWKCKKTGHMKKDCCSRKGNDGTGSNGSKDPENQQGYNSDFMQNFVNVLHYVSVISDAFYVQDDKVAWWVDSGATSHVCKDLRWFQVCKSIEDGSFVKMGNVATEPINGIGRVLLTFTSGKTLCLDNVLAVIRLIKPKMKNVGEKGIDCIFIGYAKHSKCYVIEPNDYVSVNSIIESRDAIFDEERFTSIPRPRGMIQSSSSKIAEDEVEESHFHPGAQDEGHAGSNPDEQAEGQDGPDPGNVEESQPMPSPVVYAGSDREHMNLDVDDVSPLPPPEQIDEWFTATAYPKVQENLKLTVEEQVILEEPVSSSGTLSSLQHLTKELSFDMSSIPPMKTPTIDLTSRPGSPKVHQLLKETTTETTTTITTTIRPPPSQQQQSTSDAMMMKRICELEHIMANLIQENKRLEQRLDSHGARLYTLEQLDIPHRVSKAVDEVVTDAVDWAMQALLRNRFRDLPEADMKEILHQQLAKDLAEARKKKKKSRKSPKTPPGSPPHQPHPPPPPAGTSGASESPGASGSSQVPPPPPSINQESQSKGSVAPSSSKTAASAEYQAWTTTDIRLRLSISLTPVDLQIDEDMAPDEQAQSSNDVDTGNAHIPRVNLRKDWWKSLKEERPATPEPAWSILSFDVSVPTNNWASALAHTSEGDRRAVRTHMRILSVIRIEVFSMYGYDYMKKIVLCRTDLNEHVIAERDFKYLYPSDFEDLYLLNLQGHLNHLPPKDKKILTTAVNLRTKHLVIRQRVEDFQLGIESYQTQLNLTKPRWDVTGFEYKHDYTVIDSPRAIDEALDYRIKEFKINRMNPGLNTRFWTRKDVDMSKEFMFAIQKRLKTKRIFRNLESFVGGRVRDGDYRLLKLVSNLLVHSFRALSTLRRSGLRTTSTAAKPCQVDFLGILSDHSSHLAAIHDLVIHQIDVKTAFLNGDLDEEIYMKQPEGFVMPGHESKDLQ
nr:hypothetical protein [Tanacetum cinerariifolium]